MCAVTSKTCQRKNRHTGRVSVTTKTASVRSDAPRALQVRASDALLHAEDNPVTLRHSDTGSYPWSRCPGCTIPRRCSPTHAVGSTPRLCCSLRDGRCRHRPFTRLDLGMSLNCPGTSRSVGVQLFFSHPSLPLRAPGPRDFLSPPAGHLRAPRARLAALLHVTVKKFANPDSKGIPAGSWRVGFHRPPACPSLRSLRLHSPSSRICRYGDRRCSSLAD